MIAIQTFTGVVDRSGTLLRLAHFEAFRHWMIGSGPVITSRKTAVGQWSPLVDGSRVGLVGLNVHGTRGAAVEFMRALDAQRARYAAHVTWTQCPGHRDAVRMRICVELPEPIDASDWPAFRAHFAKYWGIPLEWLPQDAAQRWLRFSVKPVSAEVEHHLSEKHIESLKRRRKQVRSLNT